jgi:hypothetical protein
MQYDERTFAKKVVKINKTLKKLENGRKQEPNISNSFNDLSNILIQNFKDNTSIGSSIIGGGNSSLLSGMNRQFKESSNSR